MSVMKTWDLSRWYGCALLLLLCCITCPVHSVDPSSSSPAETPPAASADPAPEAREGIKAEVYSAEAVNKLVMIDQPPSDAQLESYMAHIGYPQIVSSVRQFLGFFNVLDNGLFLNENIIPAQGLEWIR